LHFHGGNLSELQDHVPVDILPSCLGGIGGQNDNAALIENLYKNEEYFKENFSSYGYVYDEVATEATEETPQQNSVLTTVAEVGSYLGSYYRRICIE
ncbi:hypothetical protein Anas_12016, partial [Armadillidium nasatum]